MNDIQTIKVSPQSIEIPAISIYVHAISILVTLFLFKLIFGKQISNLLSIAKDKLVDTLNKKSHSDWVANCKERKLWPQKQDALGLDLKGHYLKSLYFSIALIGKPQHWRAGFVLGNEKLKANQIIETENGITIHIGSDYDKKEKIIPIWKYYDNFSNNNPDFSSVKFDKMEENTFSVNINNNNFMIVKVNEEIIFAKKIESSFRRRVYLKAWVDTSPDCKVKFKNIKYSLMPQG